ncbi:carbohydrate ABC transporter permease [uncultured Alsobacter sp.]|uniref:carbohydrate ABC transporter permease n=1 Tax=uncultured Alsobacter sp. TaxID=1748258 RepID=UPI0025CF0EAA|nr:carbohydrate ABC transporter permease [uncultured Alsobacter sp.]
MGHLTPLQRVFLAVALVVIVAPFLWILMNSFKYQIAIYQGSWVFEPTLSNYTDVLFSRRSRFSDNLWNSVVVAVTSTTIVLVLGTLAAYSLNRFPWAPWVSRGLMAWLVVFHMVPVLTLVGPWYLIFRHFGLYDTLTGLVLTHVTLNLPMAIWLMLAFVREVPREMEEAAEIDGCSRIQTFGYVVLPVIVPGLIATGVLSFIFSWNEFAVALNLTSRATATVPVGVAKFAQEYEIQHAQMAAASILATIPAILIMFFGQKFVVRGLTLGSVK